MADTAVCDELVGAALLAALEQRFDAGLLPPREPQAIIHPNGFVKLPLARTGDGDTRLFLHVWRADSADAAVHDHRWAFASAVLCGELSHTLMDVTVTPGSAGSPPNCLPVARYRPEDGKHCFDTSHDETAVVNHRRTQVFSAGQRYGMDAFVFHRAHARAGAMTFVARGLPRRAYSRVLLDGEAVPPETRQWRRLDEAERRQHLRAALAALDALEELARPEALG
ncbi:hypothetical protein [Streptomyces flavofungini]|uniref:Uncharacterized protein n=1 Tax=Streptomyces flavofungini TaxID=68200 RepID=A0ABS0X0Q2_9ACTN|nr:hypothetical protein [Streptomyces flavofungini]MBJ3806767.1 hypothetical protein [Streptomyces flavofungini]GHC60653.1 hypothetical protein GCM10010349_30120 [Streptomyces flavofungini]